MNPSEKVPQETLEPMSDGDRRVNERDAVLRHFMFEHYQKMKLEEIPDAETAEGEARIKKDIADYIKEQGFYGTNTEGLQDDEKIEVDMSKHSVLDPEVVKDQRFVDLTNAIENTFNQLKYNWLPALKKQKQGL